MSGISRCKETVESLPDVLVQNQGYLHYLARIVPALSGLVSSILFVGLLSVDEFAKYSMALPVVAIVNAILFSWNTQSFARAYAENLNQIGALKGSALRTWARSALVTTVSVAIIAVAGLSEIGGLAACACLVAITLPLYELHVEFARSSLQPRIYAVAVTAYGVASLGVGGIAALFGLGACAPFIGLAVGHVGGALMMYLWRSFSRPHIRSRVRPAGLDSDYAKAIAVAVVLSIAMSMIDRYLLAHYVGLASVASYSLAHSLTFAAFALVGSVASFVTFPLVMRAAARCDESGIERVLRAQANIFILAFVPMVLVAFTCTFRLADLVHGDYADSLRILPLLSIAALLNVLRGNYLDMNLHIERKAKAIMVSMMTAVVIEAIGVMVFVPEVGPAGAALALLLAYLASAVVSIYSGRHARRLPLPEKKVAILVCTASSIVALIAIIVPSFGGLLQEILFIACMVLCLLAILMAMARIGRISLLKAVRA